MEEEKISSIAEMINGLTSVYKENPYMLQRLETHLLNLPNVLNQENKRYEERVSRINELTLEQDNFYKVFLSKHQYYYMPYNNIYYEYDGKTYKIVNEDDIHHRLLSTITNEGKLIQWKHKTKQNIIRQIKDRSLFKSTPETYTIQNVLGFLQTIFQSKSEAKYCLTIIGDCILKKNTENLLFFVSSNLKRIITLIDTIIYITTGTSIMNNFITKYHDSHKLSSYRLIKTNETTNTLSTDIVKKVLDEIGIDLLCVSAHYSERYGYSDNYLNNKVDTDVKNYTLYFTTHPLEQIVDEFVSHCIESINSENTFIPWKSMHYIWKLYLSSINVPNMVYSTQLQLLLGNKLTNVTENGNILFTHVTSKYLPSVSSFLSFWEKHIIVIADANIDDEYEIDELMTLYKLYDKKNTQMTDVNMIKMIGHYFSPQVEVIDNKYVTNIRCNLWSKSDDISECLQSYKYTNKTNNEMNNELISLDDLYQFYQTFFKAKSTVEHKNYPIVSKHFFEKFVSNTLSTYIKFDKFVSSEWLLE